MVGTVLSLGFLSPCVLHFKRFKSWSERGLHTLAVLGSLRQWIKRARWWPPSLPLLDDHGERLVAVQVLFGQGASTRQAEPLLF
mmetsp:Transcript_50772/g.133457  ORF Transcript_50772/g.133457 Transcript_50772/m.133457 type:complete len:84 (-) Transcript_50772:6-257(-)